MFAYITKVPASERTSQSDELFRRFLDTPGLLHAFDLEGEDDPDDAFVVAVWENREAAERYLKGSPLKQEVDTAMPSASRTMYRVVAGR